MVGKDLNTIWGRKGIRALLMMLPVVLVIIIPIIYLVAINLISVVPGSALPQAVLSLMPEGTAELEYQQAWTSAFTTLICPMLFLCVPILCAAASAACAFVGEKEGGTLETLLLSSMNPKSIFNAKISGCTLLSVIISLIAFVAFAITITVADIMIGAPYFFNFEWLIVLFLMMPLCALFSTTFISLIVSRVHSVGEALQTIGYLILPVIILYLIQFTGVFRLNVLFLIILAVLLAVFSIVIYNASAHRFLAEKLLARSWEG